MNAIKKVNANLFELFNFTVEFSQGINFIAGENGTGKSRLLELIKNNLNNPSIVVPESAALLPERTAFYNPKRNAQKKDIVGLSDQLKREGKKIETFIAQLAQNYAEGSVDYPNFPDLLVTEIDQVISSNRTPSYAVNKVKKDFEKVIKKVLPYFDIEARWDTTSGQPELNLKKYGMSISSGKVSIGENEIISLTTSIYASRKIYDIYLIDEPEIHLNWSLEKNLFDYLNWFATSEKKQLIIITHSPVVFEKEYESKTTFLGWDNGNIVPKKDVTENIASSLASRIASTIQVLDDAYDHTFVVEDNMHKYVLDAIAKEKSKKILVLVAGDKKKVISMHKVISPTLSNIYFMVDGDNDDYNNSKLSGNIFALKKYCIENYLLDTRILSGISKSSAIKSEIQIKELIIQKIKTHRNPEFKKRYIAYIKLADLDANKFFEIMDTIDGSFLINETDLISDLGFSQKEVFVNSYINFAKHNRRLHILFSEIAKKI